jgi:Ca2+-binding RTX toxin-like protein
MPSWGWPSAVAMFLAALAAGHARPAVAGAGVGVAGVGSPGQLLARDPGARVGGNTIVATDRGEKVFGVPRRPNFILGLGSNETISGGAGDDQIRAFGVNVTIRGGRGDDLVYGGPSGTLIGGPGHDLLIESGADATVRITGKHTEVVASGHNDRILCSSGSGRDVIYAAAGTALAPSCRKVHDRIPSMKDLRTGGLATGAAASTVTGDGSN